MKNSVSWLGEARRIALLLVFAGLLGWMMGKAVLFVALTLLALQLYWLLQLRRIQGWLRSPETDAPEGVGIWGDIFDQIYSIQRRNLEAHTRLQSTVDYLHDSLASMRDGAVMLDKNGAIEWSNEAAETLLGLRYPADKGQGILNLVRAPEFHQYFLDADFSEPLHLEVNSVPQRNLRIDTSCFGAGDRLMFVRDVTKIIRLEQMRRDFVGNVSHELRTPLTVISGYLGTMLAVQDTIDVRFRKPLQQMEQQAQRMESLLKDLLWLSRLENLEFSEKDQLVDVAGLLQELAVEIRQAYPTRDIELDLETDYKVRGEHRELYSAVSNLVQNALKYSSESSPVRISWRREGDDYLLAVIDQGVGIEASHLPRLTERFYRVDDSRSSATGGTGLGLAIVKHIAAGHNAELRIESVVGLGSKFILVFSPET
ncbi:MAG: phosphate regulon sensor histidine kinase PhoR [Proteobacteria bacterium]|nr:phosphate regulon sensor histidine kinase PhoR [Pseudomonadota bacterium]